MADNTKIEWADATLNYVNGCSVTSPGCTNCYAMRLAGTRLKHHPSRAGLTTSTKAGPVWTGEVRDNSAALEQALRWKKPRAIFWNAHGDLFHENVPDEWIDRQFAVMALTPQHRHMVLTKRSARMREYLSQHRWHIWSAIGRGIDPKRWRNLPPIIGGDCTPVPNVWLGVSVEDQRRADERIPDLLATPAAVRFISAEPLLGPVDLTMIDVTVAEREQAEPSGLIHLDALTGVHRDAEDSIEGVLDYPDPKLDWVIVGGESGPGSRPMHPDWARSLRDQCEAAGVAFHFKQWGEHLLARERHLHGYPPGDFVDHLDVGQGFIKVGKARAGRLLDGVTHDGVPT